MLSKYAVKVFKLSIGPIFINLTTNLLFIYDYGLYKLYSENKKGSSQTVFRRSMNGTLFPGVECKTCTVFVLRDSPALEIQAG